MWVVDYIGTEVPVFDIAHHYQSGDSHDFLVRSKHLGEALAACFSRSQATYVKVGTSIVNRITGSQSGTPPDPDHNVVLMKGHGFTTAAPSIELAVYQAIYTPTAAKAQTTALLTKKAYFAATLDGIVNESGKIKQASIESTGGLHYLSAQEAADAWAMNRSSSNRPWQLWEREVSISPLYINELKKSS